MEEKNKKQLIQIAGEDNISFNIEDRLCYSRDITPVSYKWLNVYRKPPYLCDCVFRPLTVKQIRDVLEFCNKNRVPATVYGGGSGTVGGVFPLEGGITIDMSQFNRILNLDEESGLVTVESGMIGDKLEKELNFAGFTMRHFPQSLKSASVGGLIATKSVGQFSTKYGGIENILISLDVMLPNGKIISTTKTPRTSTGPDLKSLFIGSEGIFGIILNATLKIIKIPEKIVFRSYLCSDFYDGINAVREMLQSGIQPPVVRLYNKEESGLKFKKLGLNKAGSLLILCFEGKERIVNAEIAETEIIYRRNNLEYIGEEIGKMWFEHRYDTKGIMEYNRMTGGISDAIEISVNWVDINDLYKEVISYFKKKQIRFAAHLSHIYQTGASIYFIFYIKSDSENDAIELFHKTWNEVLEITLGHNGSISHHHGIGIIKKEMLKKETGYGFELISSIKNLIDPNKILNNGKIVD